MPRGNASQIKVIYQGKIDTFVVFVESKDMVESWKKDRSIPLAQVVAGFKIFYTHGHGAQNVGDAASKAQMENEFGTNKDDDVIIKILEQGEIQAVENPERQGATNVTKGPMVAH